MRLTGNVIRFAARSREGLFKVSGGVLWILFLLAWGPVDSKGAVFHKSIPGAGSSNTVERLQSSLREALRLQQTGSNSFRIGQVELDAKARTLSIPASVRLTNFVVEYALVTEEGKGYESLLTTTARPEDIHVAALLLGLCQCGVTGELNQPAVIPETNAVSIDVIWETNGGSVRVPLSKLIQVTSGHPDRAAPVLGVQAWLYNGSMLDPSGFGAAREGSIISLIRDPVALINNLAPDRDQDEVHFPNQALLPALGTKVTVVIKRSSPAEIRRSKSEGQAG